MRQAWLAAALCVGLTAGPAGASGTCPPRGVWLDPAAGAPLDAPQLIAQAARAQVVLLGEQHAQPEHQRWQLHTLAALHAHRPDLVLGLEMFPRRVQGVLDRWIAGELDERSFLRESEWDSVWGYDPAPYLPLFHFARMHRIPMVAMNVDRAVMGRIREHGFDNVPRAERDGVGRPAAPVPAYRESLEQVYRRHARGHSQGPAAAPPGAGSGRGLERFIEAQLTWDRAMAEAIHGALQRETPPLVVGLMGSGHVEYRHGVPAQLADLGVAEARVLMAWPEGRQCERVRGGLADAVFGLQPWEGPPRLRLGVVLAPVEGGGVRVDGVEPDGVGAAAGLREADLILRAGGQAVRSPRDLVAVVRQQAPGSWLPLEVQRGERREELIAKFPAP